jgi:hypothetical protein
VVNSKRKSAPVDQCVVIETLKTGAIIHHGPFRHWDEAYDWKLAMEEFAEKHSFNWKYNIRTLVAPSVRDLQS